MPKGLKNADIWKLTDTHKWCPRCQRMLLHGSFRVVKPGPKAGRSGLHGWCDECNVAQSTARRRAAGQAPRRLVDLTETHKRCSRCQEMLPHGDFYAHRGNGRSELTSACTKCLRCQLVFTQYGITCAELDEMVLAQEGRCASCGDATDLRVDHNHATGAVRALLCHHCNTGAGHMFDSPARCRALAAYLEGHQ